MSAAGPTAGPAGTREATPGLARPTVALMQPTFLPWQGYFGLVASADVFVFLDDFQFVRRSFMHRNRLFVAREKPSWISLPVEHGGARAALNEVRPRLDEDGFRAKLLRTLAHAYAKCEFLGPMLAEVEAWLAVDWSTLADMNIAFIEAVARRLELAPRFLRSSQLPAEGKRSARLASILRHLGAGTYLSARGSYDYMVEDAVFPLDDVAVRFQRYEPQPYAQRQSSTFVSHLSVLDGLIQLGPARAREVVLAGQRDFTPWHLMTTDPVDRKDAHDDQAV